MIKAVVDTNVFVSSFFGGNPRRIVDLWKTGRIVLCLSEPIVEEYMEVLRRLELDSEPEYGELLRLFSQGVHVLYTAKTPSLQIVEDDPDDDKFVECAVALGAEVVISGDKVLTAVGSYMKITIMTPRAFLDRYRDTPR